MRARTGLLLAILLAALTVVAACGGGGGGGGGSTGGTDATTYWTVYHTPTGGPELGPDYVSITQSGSNYSGSFRCGLHAPLSVTMSGSNVTLAWTDLIDNITLNGTTTANTMAGSYGGGTWRAAKVSDSACTYPWSVKDGVYRVWGSTTFVWPGTSYDLSTLNQADWTLIGEGTSTQSFTVGTAYTSILIAWSGSTKFYIDAAMNGSISSLYYGTGRSLSLANYSTNTSNTVPVNLTAQDGAYTQTFGKGFVMLGTDMGLPVVTLSGGVGTVTVYATTIAP